MSERSEVIRGRLGCRHGASNSFATYEATLRREDQTIRQDLDCRNCGKQVNFRVLGTRTRIIWRWIIGVLVLCASLGAAAAILDIIGLYQIGLAAIGFGVAAFGGMAVRILYAVSLGSHGIHTAYANHVFFVDGVDVTTTTALEAAATE